MEFDKLVLHYYPDPILKTKCHDIDPSDPNLGTVLERMVAIMYAAGGVGLAAPQIGLDWNVFIVDVGQDEEPRALINPRIESFGENICYSEEGCVSMPGVKAKLNKRHEKITISAFMPGGDERVTVELNSRQAIIFQHEYEHLQGITIFDHMSQLTRSLAKKKYLKKKKEFAKLMKQNNKLRSTKEQLENLIKKVEETKSNGEQNQESTTSNDGGSLGNGGCVVDASAGTDEGDSRGVNPIE